MSADPAPTSVQITTSNQNVKAPSTVLPRANQTRLTFQLSAAATAGPQTVAVIASQGGETVQDTVQVEAGSRPVLTVPGSQSAKPGTPLGFEVKAADPAEQAINLMASNLPAGATFDGAAGRFEWTPAASQNGTYNIQFTATDQTGKSSVAQVKIDVTSGEPAVASAQGACSPGATASLTGSWLSTQVATLSDPSGNSTDLGGTRVTVNGQYAAVLSASSTEVQFLCPDLTSETTLRVAVETDAGVSPLIGMPMANGSPRIFALGGSMQGVVSFSNTSELAMARNSQTPAHPAQPGDEIVLWGTGFGAAGQISAGQLAVQVGGVDSNADAVQAVPGHAGVYAVQVRVPAAATLGDNVPVQVQVTGMDGKTVSSNIVTIAIEPTLQ